MTKSQDELERILKTANALVRGVIAETDRIVNTPTKEWIVSSRQRAMEVLSARALTASATFSQWIEQSIWIKDMGKICGCLDMIRTEAHHSRLADNRYTGRAGLKQDPQGNADREIIGVIADTVQDSLTEPPQPFAVFPFAQASELMRPRLVIRVAGDPMRYEPVAARVVKDLDQACS